MSWLECSYDEKDELATTSKGICHNKAAEAAFHQKLFMSFTKILYQFPFLGLLIHSFIALTQFKVLPRLTFYSIASISFSRSSEMSVGFPRLSKGLIEQKC